MVAYTASKWALTGLMKNAAMEYAPKGIRVNSIAPSSVDTPMVIPPGPQGEEIRKKLTDMKPLLRLTKPEEIARMCVYLCSDTCPTTTGAMVTIDAASTLK
jgi:3alpha(or 20beta)-hydroxysteroid dehydrogenase